jgi:peptide/nickel transport system permease protein
MAEHSADQAPIYSREWRPKTGEELQTDLVSSPVPRRRNWPLWAGVLIVSFVVFIAVFGPALSRQDPMQENTILQTGETWETPPFPPWTVPGFPLGSDQFGRDLLSRLLWGVRPTLVMVLIVATVRLVLGIVIGLGAGWSTGRLGHLLDMAIGAAFSIPVLIVALAAIAVIGVEWGLLAFIIGLSITGWVETARYVRERTQITRGNLFIEAARALGASDRSILQGHVLRQIMPMLWMLFAFQISSTLMTTAGLGFLGYYIGGDEWVDVADFVARRISGMPELGQMLASAWSEQQVITEPWGMIVAGSAIFVAILGFNLLGEGLRQRLSLENVHRRTALADFRYRVTGWAQEKGLLPELRDAQGGMPVRSSLRWIAATMAILIAAGGGLLWWQRNASEAPGKSDSVLVGSGPEALIWTTERHDAQGTLWTGTEGPSTPDIQWIFQEPTGLAGGPAVNEDGTIYVASGGGILYALDPSANVLWEAALPAGGVGSPALSADGTIYVADQNGGLSTYLPDGTPLWQYEPDSGGKAITGPVLASDGTAYYPGGGKLHAVSSTGELVWSTRAPYGFDPIPPLLSPNGELLFYLDAAVNTSDGSPHDLSAVAGAAGNEQFFVGADQRTYYRSQGNVLEWEADPSGAEIVQSFNKQIPGHPRDTGVTPDGIVWATYRVGYGSPYSGIVWLDKTDQVLGNIEFEQNPVRTMAVTPENVVYTCGNLDDGSLGCSAAKPGAEELVWEITLDQDDEVVGGALVPQRLLVALAKGSLIAVGALESESETAAGNGGEPKIVKAIEPSQLPTPTATVPVSAQQTPPTPTPLVAPVQHMVKPSPEALRPGDTVTYTLTVANNGPSDAADVVFTDTLPTGLTLHSAVTSLGNACDVLDRRITCRLGDLPKGTTAQITLTASAGAIVSDVLSNFAFVGSRTSDPNLADNTAEQQRRFSPAADLALGQFDVPDPVAAGSTLTYTLVVTNSGPAGAMDVTLRDIWPLHALFVSASASPGVDCSVVQARVLDCDLAFLPPGASATVALVLHLAPSLSGTITNTASIAATTIDVDPLNNSDRESTGILPEPDAGNSP